MVEWLLKLKANFRRQSIVLFATFYLMHMPVLALDFDTSLDDEVRKNYNPSKIEKDMALPALPKILNEKTPQNINEIKTQTPNLKPIPKPQVQSQTVQYKQPIKLSAESYATLKQGTKIKVKLLNNISDNSKKGTRVEFVSKYPVSTTYFTIPMGTIFKGEIMNSHKPQFSGNGGLIVLKVDSAILNGETQPINACVTKADSKKIFFNNIKGKRKYAVSMLKSLHPGVNFFKKMMGTTAYLASDGSSIVVAPFSLGIGVIVIAGNAIISPALAMFHKGGSISISEGSEFEIKLLQDVFIYN